MDRFDALAPEPIAWHETALTYVVAANYLLEMNRPRKGWSFSNSGNNWPVMLLFAVAAENLVKAVRIAQGDVAPIAGKSLHEYYTSHDLLKYAVDAGLVLGKSERSLLVRLQHVLEAGKYPVAKRPGQSTRAWQYDSDQDARRVWRLLQKLDGALRKTGARCLPEYDLAKLHSPT